MLTAMEEIYFWSGIMRDHADFQIASLSSREPESVREAYNFMKTFDDLKDQAKALINKSCYYDKSIITKSLSILQKFINFKRLLLKRLLECNIEINFTPTFINHMINEAMEFYNILCIINNNQFMNEVVQNLYFHKIWLLDASGHAASIACGLDRTEYILRGEAEKFKKTFDDLYIKASELEQMLERTCICDGALCNLNEEARRIINDFICYLEKIEKLRKQCKALGNINPMMPDHMIRESKYYLMNIQRDLKGEFIPITSMFY